MSTTKLGLGNWVCVQKGLQRNRIIKSIEKIEWCSKYEAHVIVIVGGGGIWWPSSSIISPRMRPREHVAKAKWGPRWFGGQLRKRNLELHGSSPCLLRSPRIKAGIVWKEWQWAENRHLWNTQMERLVSEHDGNKWRVVGEIQSWVLVRQIVEFSKKRRGAKGPLDLPAH